MDTCDLSNPIDTLSSLSLHSNNNNNSNSNNKSNVFDNVFKSGYLFNKILGYIGTPEEWVTFKQLKRYRGYARYTDWFIAERMSEASLYGLMVYKLKRGEKVLFSDKSLLEFCSHPVVIADESLFPILCTRENIRFCANRLSILGAVMSVYHKLPYQQSVRPGLLGDPSTIREVQVKYLKEVIKKLYTFIKENQKKDITQQIMDAVISKTGSTDMVKYVMMLIGIDDNDIINHYTPNINSIKSLLGKSGIYKSYSKDDPDNLYNYLVKIYGKSKIESIVGSRIELYMATESMAFLTDNNLLPDQLDITQLKKYLSLFEKKDAKGKKVIGFDIGNGIFLYNLIIKYNPTLINQSILKESELIINSQTYPNNNNNNNNIREKYLFIYLCITLFNYELLEQIVEMELKYCVLGGMDWIISDIVKKLSGDKWMGRIMLNTCKYGSKNQIQQLINYYYESNQTLLVKQSELSEVVNAVMERYDLQNRLALIADIVQYVYRESNLLIKNLKWSDIDYHELIGYYLSRSKSELTLESVIATFVPPPVTTVIVTPTKPLAEGLFLAILSYLMDHQAWDVVTQFINVQVTETNTLSQDQILKMIEEMPLELIRHLVEAKGVTIPVSKQHYDSPLFVRLGILGSMQWLNYILENADTIHPRCTLALSVEYGHMEMFIDLFKRDSFDSPPMEGYVIGGQMEIIEYIHNTLNGFTTDFFQREVINWAIIHSRIEILQLYLSMNENSNLGKGARTILKEKEFSKKLRKADKSVQYLVNNHYSN